MLQLMIGHATQDKLRYAQALLSHRLASGDIAQVFDCALDALIPKLEKQIFAATSRPRRAGRSSADLRHIPAHVKRAVWERDQGHCTFVSASGQVCGSRRCLQFDHVVPVARGGRSTVENLRLRCRGHNQYEADRVFGAGFMSAKRDAGRRAAAEAAAAVEAPRTAAEPEGRSPVAAEAEVQLEAAVEAEARATAAAAEAEARRQAEAEARARALAQEHAEDVMSCLHELGFRAAEARRAVEYSATLADATFEERVRAALRYLAPKPRFHGRVGTSRRRPPDAGTPALGELRAGDVASELVGASTSDYLIAESTNGDVRSCLL